ncbi:hypothetical protein KFE80_02105 [bacterium SCSIO 12696]|nr:hypothetical protein KFE80_02105 [bacterium SCSIO 12696]
MRFIYWLLAISLTLQFNIMDVNGDAVERLFAKYHVDKMIHGHTHRPARHHHNGGERIVLGDWHHHGWILTADQNNLELSSFEIAPEN